MRGTKAKRLRKQAKLFNKGTQMPYSAFEWRPQRTAKRVLTLKMPGYDKDPNLKTRVLVKPNAQRPRDDVILSEEPYLAKSVALVHGCTRQLYQMLKRVA